MWIPYPWHSCANVDGTSMYTTWWQLSSMHVNYVCNLVQIYHVTSIHCKICTCMYACVFSYEGNSVTLYLCIYLNISSKLKYIVNNRTLIGSYIHKQSLLIHTHMHTHTYIYIFSNQGVLNVKRIKGLITKTAQFLHHIIKLMASSPLVIKAFDISQFTLYHKRVKWNN